MDLPNLGYVPPLQPHQIFPLNHLEDGNQKLFAENIPSYHPLQFPGKLIYQT